jgi:hypothetical protein
MRRRKSQPAASRRVVDGSGTGSVVRTRMSSPGSSSYLFEDSTRLPGDIVCVSRPSILVKTCRPSSTSAASRAAVLAASPLRVLMTATIGWSKRRVALTSVAEAVLKKTNRDLRPPTDFPSM